MHMKVPEVNKCCCCCPLRWGIMLFGYINLIFSILAVTYLLMRIDILKSMVRDTSLELISITALFGILGMGVILNVLLLYAGHKKDVTMLRLYNFYALFTALTALVPTFILLSQRQYLAVLTVLFDSVMKYYVIILVRSEILKLEERNHPNRPRMSSADPIIQASDRDTLL